MEFEAIRDDGLVHTFNVESQVLIPSYCGRRDYHYKEHAEPITPDDPRCEECDRIAHEKKGVTSHLADAFFQLLLLRKGQLDQQDLILDKLDRSVHAIAKEVYTLKKQIKEAG